MRDPYASKHLTVYEYILVGIYIAVYFVLVTIATFASALLIPGFSYVLLPAISALITGYVYMLMVGMRKFGCITMMGLVMGLFFFASGHFVLSFAANVVCGIAADLVGKLVEYKNKLGVMVSCVIFSYGLTGPVLPMWFMKDAYVANLVARGKDAAYIDAMFAHINTGTFVLCIVSTLVCAVLGGEFALRLMKKHVDKAGRV